MTSADFYTDLKFILDRIFREQEMAVKRWSTAECDDYQIPLAILTGLLSNGDLRNPPWRLTLRDAPAFNAIIDIIQNSHIGSLLYVDREKNCIRFRDGTPESAKLEVLDFVVANTQGYGCF